MIANTDGTVAMGNFYSNLTLRSAQQEQVARFLRDRRSYVSRTENAYTVVLDEECDTQNAMAITELSLALSSEFRCAVFALLIHDDDILVYFLCKDGQILDEYNSFPGYFEESGPDGDIPTGGDANKLAQAFGVADVQQIEAILRTPHGDGQYLFETDRHRDLAKVLGIPEVAVGVGFNYFAAGDFSAEVTGTSFLPTFGSGQ